MYSDQLKIRDKEGREIICDIFWDLDVNNDPDIGHIINADRDIVDEYVNDAEEDVIKEYKVGDDITQLFDLDDVAEQMINNSKYNEGVTMTTDNLLLEMANNLLDEGTKDIKATHEGLEKLPEDAWNKWGVGKLVSHFISLAKKIGKPKVMRSITNIERWNKKKNVELSDKARSVIDKLKASDKWESLSESVILEFTDQIKSLANLSKKSPQAVETVLKQVHDQMEKTSPLWKKYQNEKQDNRKQDILNQYNGEVLKAVKQKLGIKKEVTIEDSSAAITTGSIGSSTTSDGSPAPYGSSAVYASKWGSVMKRKVPVAESYIDKKLELI
jgi:endonuclease III